MVPRLGLQEMSAIMVGGFANIQGEILLDNQRRQESISCIKPGKDPLVISDAR